MPAEVGMDDRPGDGRPFVMFVAGMTPAEIIYGPLLGVIGEEVRAGLKDLEVFAGDAPPPDYGFDMEVEGIKRVADEAGEESFHLVGFSGGGSAGLAFAAKYPGRAASLALIEPAWIGNEGWTPEESAFWAEGDEAMSLPPPEQMGRFFRLVLGPGVEPPTRPTGPPPPWMANRPEGLKALHNYFRSHTLDPETLCAFRNPVYLARGALSDPAWGRMAERLSGMLPNIEVEVYEERHHLDAPHVAEPERFARALRELWGARSVQDLRAGSTD